MQILSKPRSLECPVDTDSLSPFCQFCLQLQALDAQLANPMEQISFWKANQFSASQEIPRDLWNPKVHYRIHKSLPSVPVLTHIYPVHAHPTSWSFILILSLPLKKKDKILELCPIQSDPQQLYSVSPWPKPYSSTNQQDWALSA